MQRGRPTAWRCAMATSIRTKRRRALARWTALLQRYLPTLSLPQAKGLALWSIGIVLARSSSLHAVVLALVCCLRFNPTSLRKRLQEWDLEASAQKGHGRRPRGGPDREAARQLAAQVNAQLAVGAPAALSFEPLSIPQLRQRWLEHHEQVRRSSMQTISRYRTATDHLLRFLQ